MFQNTKLKALRLSEESIINAIIKALKDVVIEIPITFHSHLNRMLTGTDDTMVYEYMPGS